VGIIPLQDLDIVLVLACAEAGKGLPRAVLVPEEVDGQSAYKAGAVVTVA
jgi:hypothetical protein